MKTEKPAILVIDDQPEDVRNVVRIGLGDQATAEIVHQRDTELEHLERADLVLVDYRLEDWPERQHATLAGC